MQAAHDRPDVAGGRPGGRPGRGLAALAQRRSEPRPRRGRRRLAAIAWPFPRDALAGRPRLAARRHSRSMSGPSSASAATARPAWSTDEEVDRVTDVDLLDERFVPAKEGLAVRIADLVRPRAALSLQADRRRDAPCRRHCGFAQVRSRHRRDRRQPFGRARTHRGLSASRVEHGAGLDQPGTRRTLNASCSCGPPRMFVVSTATICSADSSQADCIRGDRRD